MVPYSSFNALVRWLSRPSSYPHPVDKVDVLETHISVVFLAGQYAYKLKRPVRFDFLDFSTVDKREIACREEVCLNRRLAPDTYLGVVPVSQMSDSDFELNGNPPPVDWLVHMRRLPIDQTLDRVLSSGNLLPYHIDRVALVLADFYRNLQALPLTAAEYRERYIAHIQGNFAELLAVSHHCPENTIRRIHGFQLQLLHLQPELFDARVQAGRVVEGHGDLRPEHICFTDPITIFDCIEFSSDFRRIDVADELAFLATECDFMGASWIGQQLFQKMELLLDDHPSSILIDFYKSYRACVRAKVNALRADQLSDNERKVTVAAAVRHLELADSYVQPWLHPVIIVVGGLSGTGKSTLARRLSELLGCQLLQTDAIRKQMYGKSELPADYDHGNYIYYARQRVYSELINQAGALLQAGVSVVLDGTFSSAEALRQTRQIASDNHSHFLALECTCDPNIARKRIAKRLAVETDFSEMRPELHDQQSMTWEVWPQDECHIRIDTEQPIEVQLKLALSKLRDVINAETPQ
jgi:uncharacterized protein